MNVEIATTHTGNSKEKSDIKSSPGDTLQADSVNTKSSPPTILSYLKDLPNLCSLAGLACTLLAIYFSVLAVYHAAMIGMIWAVAFDWADGLIARRIKGRTGNDRAFGAQLDVLIDIVSYGVTPAIFLLSYGKFDPLFLAVAFIMLAASAMPSNKLLAELSPNPALCARG